MTETENFAHGFHYGDYSGVVFYGPPTDGFWLERLAVSDIYIGPLLHGILDRGWRESGGGQIPRLVSDWNALRGWASGGGPLPLPTEEATEFAEALARLAPDDVTGHCAGCTAEECLRCAVVIREFIVGLLARGVGVFIEDD